MVKGQRFYKTLNQIVKYNDKCYEDRIAIDVICDKTVIMAMYDFVKPNSYVLDIGASIGLITLTLNMFIGKDKSITYFCYEPCHETYQMLAYNVNSAQNYNILTFNFALSNAEGVENLVHFKDYSSMNEIFDERKVYNEEYYTDSEEIYCRHLDSLFSEVPAKPCSVVKIDVEGHEYEVLLGGKKFFANYKPPLVIEILAENRDKVFDLLKEMNYGMIEQLDHINYIFKHLH